MALFQLLLAFGLGLAPFQAPKSRHVVHAPPPELGVQSAPSDFVDDFDDSGDEPSLGTIDVSKGYVDVTFVAEGYAGTKGMAQFLSDAKTYREYLLTYEPFRSNANAFRFHAVENEESLGCGRAASIPRLITCDVSKAKRAAKKAGVPFDKIVVIVNDADYGGSGGEISVTYNGRRGDRVFVHEFGHSFGRLKDEYVAYDGDGEIDGKPHANCFAGKPPASEWDGTREADYRLGCTYRNWYRSSPGSLMLTLDETYFNEVSKQLLKRAIDAYSGR
ncbi:MAG: hypothetical protein HY075_00390 [Deltaproteobacteria bacterium]|nr:hypothetical protein [Deltaproteobacteria bacterium]